MFQMQQSAGVILCRLALRRCCSEAVVLQLEAGELREAGNGYGNLLVPSVAATNHELVEIQQQASLDCWCFGHTLPTGFKSLAGIQRSRSGAMGCRSLSALSSALSPQWIRGQRSKL